MAFEELIGAARAEGESSGLMIPEKNAGGGRKADGLHWLDRSAIAGVGSGCPSRISDPHRENGHAGQVIEKGDQAWRRRAWQRRWRRC
jgi:hypothetical protein